MNKVVKILLLLGSLILMALFGAVAITTWSADTAWQPPDNVNGSCKTTSTHVKQSFG